MERERQMRQKQPVEPERIDCSICCIRFRRNRRLGSASPCGNSAVPAGLKKIVEASSAWAAPPAYAVPRPLTLCSLITKDPARAGRQINQVKATVAVTEKKMQERNRGHFMGRG